jgi:hypothetical protein
VSPRTITVYKNAAYPKAITEMNKATFKSRTPRRPNMPQPRQARERPQCMFEATAACHPSSTIVVSFGRRCRRHSPASPSHDIVAGVSAVTHCERLLERAGRKRPTVPREREAGLVGLKPIGLPAITSKCRSSWRCRLRTRRPSSRTTTDPAARSVAGFAVVVTFGKRIVLHPQPGPATIDDGQGAVPVEATLNSPRPHGG